MAVNITFAFSNLVPFMDSDIEMKADPRSCTSTLSLTEKERSKDWLYQELYIFNKDSSTSKPIIYKYSHVKIILRCQRTLANGKRCSNQISEDCYCKQHHKIYADGRIDEEQHDYEYFNHELAIAQLQGRGKKVSL